MSAKQDVAARLGSGKGSAGDAIIRFVEEALAGNNQKFDELREQLAELNDRFASKDELAELKSDQADVRNKLRAAAEILTGAALVHNEVRQVAVEDASQADVEAAQAAMAEAEEAVEEANTSLTELEARVASLEEWRKETVDPTLENHEERISALENQSRPINIPAPAPVEDETSVEHQPVREDDHVVPGMQPQPSRLQQVARDANPANWQGVVPWALAIVGLLFGWFVVGELLQNASKPVLWDWFAWLFVPVTAAVGFFGGGLIGQRLAGRQSMARPAEA